MPRFRTALTPLLILAAALPASAQGPEGRDLARVSLEELLNITITTATRTEERATDAPARVQVVTAAQIERRGYRSLADLLSDLPDIKIDLGGDPDYPAEVTVQGSRGTNLIVLMVDGIRISSPTNEPLPILANYPVHSVRQIEIVYGPSSALYGADAFSAVINLISRDASDRTGLRIASSAGQFGLQNYTGSYAVPVGSTGSFSVAGQVLYDRQPDLSRYYPGDFGALEAQRSGTFPTIFGPMTLDRSVSPSYEIPLSAHSLQAGFKTGGLRLTFFESRSQAPTAYAYTPDNSVYSKDAFSRNDLLVAGGSYTRDIGHVTSVSTVTFSQHELDPQSGYWNVFSNMKRSYKYAYGSMLKFEQQASWKAGAHANVTVGANVERYHATPQGADLNSPVQSGDAPGTILDTNITDVFNKLRYSNVGAYGQLQYALGNRAALVLGGRVDHNTRYGSTFNPRVGVVTHPTESTTFKLLYGTAFLAPSPYQTYSHYGGFYSLDGGETFQSDYWHLPNPDLKPQKKQTIETEVRQALGTGLTIWGSLFRSSLTDLIKHSDADQGYAGDYLGWPVAYIDFPVNEGRSATYGGTLGMDFLHTWDPERRLSARAGLSYADGWIDHEGDAVKDPIGAMAPVVLRAGVDLDWNRWSIAPRLSLVGAQRVLAFAETESLERRTLDGYTTMIVNVRRRALFPNVDVFVTVENAFDARYRHINTRAFTNPEELAGAPQNPRRFTVGLEVRTR